MMKTRSSRFFIILLHLVGVSRRRRFYHYEYYSNLFKTSDSDSSQSRNGAYRSTRSGIVGVQPWPMLMEQINLSGLMESSSSSSNSNNAEVRRKQQRMKEGTMRSSSSSSLSDKKYDYHDIIHDNPYRHEPVWLQDSFSANKKASLCLGPTGYFSECGDATLWTLKPTKLMNKSESSGSSSIRRKQFRQRLLRILKLGLPLQPPTTTIDEEEEISSEQKKSTRPTIGWTFQVVDQDYDYIAAIRAAENPSSSSSFATTSTRIETRKQRNQRKGNVECLQYDMITRSIQIEKCQTSKKRQRRRKWSFFLRQKSKSNDLTSIVWVVNEDGYLQTNIVLKQQPQKQHQKQQKKKQGQQKASSPIVQNGKNDDHTVDVTLVESFPHCLARNETTMQAILVPCPQHHPTDQQKNNQDSSTSSSSSSSKATKINVMNPIEFKFIRYHAVPALPVDRMTSSKFQTIHSRLLSQKKSNTKSNQQQQQDVGGRNYDRKKHVPPHHNNKENPNVEVSTLTNKDGTPASATTGEFQEGISSTSSSSSLPSNRDMASMRSNAAAVHPELTLSKRIQFDRIKGNDILRNTNAILLVSATSSSSSSSSSTTTTTPDKSKQQQVKKKTASRTRMLDTGVLSSSTKDKSASFANPSLATDPGAGKIHHHRIYKHTYIDSSKNGIWTDPSTGLEYHTDLCNYLGWDRKERGRHTLTGVGIYRKGYVIKVYGIAFYASKRDVLADPGFVRYADVTAEELRVRKDFYLYIRKMDTSSSVPVDPEEKIGGTFDRTIMLKTNMQLSAETMRSSLQADWSYLTDEMKNTLVGSSMKPRPADDDMLKLIQSNDNPSRCSCSQVAPPEYNANPECCARGTELVFTWLKSDHLEVRLNGRLMETFPRPDIAEGIFYEYLRHDDPISPELRDRVVDGFPFMISPLAQVKGLHMQPQQQHNQAKQQSTSDGKQHFNPFSMVGEVLGTMSHHASEFGAVAQKSIGQSIGNSAKFVIDSSTYTLQSANAKREWVLSRLVEVPGTMIKVLQKDDETMKAIESFGTYCFSEAEQMRQWVTSTAVAMPVVAVKLIQNDPETIQSASSFVYGLTSMIPFFPSMEVEDTQFLLELEESMRQASQLQYPDHHRGGSGGGGGGNVVNPFLRFLGESNYILHALDEIGPLRVHPTMDTTKRLFVTLVHFYLLLLFIVSFPGSYSTRTKLITIRKHKSSSNASSSSLCNSRHNMSDSDSEVSSPDNSDEKSYTWNDTDDFCSDSDQHLTTTTTSTSLRNNGIHNNNNKGPKVWPENQVFPPPSTTGAPNGGDLLVREKINKKKASIH